MVAEDRYAARDALELIDVEYEPLPPVVDARRALDAGAPVVRDDHEGRTDNHIFDWEAGDAGRTDAVFREAEVTVSQDMLYPRVHPAPLETCGIVADFDRVSGKLTVWATSQAPHAHRTLYAMVTGLPEHKIRVISPDIGGGFGNKVPIYPGYLCAIAGSMITGRPVKWMEDRSENLMSTCVRPGLPHARRAGRRPGRQDQGGAGQGARRPRRVQRRRAADQVPGRVLRRVHRLLRPGGRALPGDRRVHQQGAGRGGLLLLVPHHRGGLPGRADGRRAGLRAGPGPGRAADAQPAAPRAVPLHLPDRLGVRLRRLPAHAAPGHGHGRLRGAEKGTGGRTGPRSPHRHRGQLLHRGGRGRAAQAHGHPGPRHGRRGGTAGPPDRHGGAPDLGADPGAGARDHVRPDRRRGTRHLPRRRGGGARGHRPDPVRPGDLRVAVHAGVRRGHRDRGQEGARAGPDRRRGHARGRPGRPGVGAGPLVRPRRPGLRPHDRGDRAGRALSAWSCPRASRGSWTRPASTTRPT